MAMDWRGKTAVLTGSGGGIGRAVAEHLARLGMRIVLLGGKNLDKLERTREIVSRHTECLTLPGDLTGADFPAAAVAAAVAEYGGIDVLVNNAGAAQNTPFAEIGAAEFDRIMNINFRAPFFLTQAALPHLKHSPCGTIVNIASVVAHSGYPMQSVYSASKHALLGWTKSLARECFRDGVRVHAISPGGVYTDMVKLSRPDLTPEGMITPEEIAEIVDFLLTRRGNAVIDEILVHRLGKEPFLV
ncbi:MAG: SDR family oxidoreductase [Lentisphaeria bacterium]|nr:SDR family oxidoreductase [Lentisphaeria bacterium]